MARMLRRVAHFAERLTGAFFDAFTRVVSNRYVFFAVITATLGWMGFEAFSKHPIDPPKDFFPLTVLIYTLWGLWVENAMKVQQAAQSVMAQAQLDRLEAMGKASALRDDRIEALAREGLRRDEVLRELVVTVDEAVDALSVHLESEEAPP